MKKLLIISLILILGSLALFAQATGKLAGTVIDKKTGDPIENVNIIIKSTREGTSTNKAGKFVFRQVPVGNQDFSFTLIGYKPVFKKIKIMDNSTKVIEIELEQSSIEMQTMRVSENRAKKRETPISFKEFSQEELEDKYTTQDMPELLEDTPGLFNSSTGIGESKLSIRGFDAEKVQVLINGIPVNDPESQKVYWSNWTGLSSSVKNVQVQKGAGSSMYGSGAFGGSVNVETMGTKSEEEISIRTSTGIYNKSQDKIPDGDGGYDDSTPFNYNVILKYNSGYKYDKKLNYTLTLERKAGRSYQIHTDYDGWSANLETQSILGDHVLKTSLVAAPQEHHNVYNGSDPDLMDDLGREYNRDYHEYQRNYYFKPQFSIRDEWKISPFQLLRTNFFATMGRGGGQYLSNGSFNTATGEIEYYDDFLDSDEPLKSQAQKFGNHAHYIYQTYNIVLDGYQPGDGTPYSQRYTYEGEEVIPTQPSEIFTQNYRDAWRNDSRSEHEQFGLNSYYSHDVSDEVDITVGGEYRHWHGIHYRDRENFRIYDPTQPDSVREISRVERQYDSDNYVNNMSVFGKTKYKPSFIKGLSIVLDAQYAVYMSEVNEAGIRFYDYGAEKFLDETHYATKDLEDENGNKLFTEDDYQKTYDFLSPKAGANYNIDEHNNIFVNWSLAYKEPKTMDWYDGRYGPDGNQKYVVDEGKITDEGELILTKVEKFYGELEPEKNRTIEFGYGYEQENFSFNINYYNSNYQDKITDVSQSVEDADIVPDVNGDDSLSIEPIDVGLTLNAGDATFQGIEASGSWKLGQFEARGSAALAKNRWDSFNVAEVFGASSEEMEGKVAPYAPEKMASGSISYTFEELPFGNQLKVGLSANWWDDYYTNYSNEYVDLDYEKKYDEEGNMVGYNFVSADIVSSKLPSYFQVDADVKYTFDVGENDFSIRLGLNNILNEDENYEEGRIARDYNRYYYDEATGELKGDPWIGVNKLYMKPAPLFNLFLTMEVKF